MSIESIAQRFRQDADMHFNSFNVVPWKEEPRKRVEPKLLEWGKHPVGRIKKEGYSPPLICMVYLQTSIDGLYLVRVLPYEEVCVRTKPGRDRGRESFGPSVFADSEFLEPVIATTCLVGGLLLLLRRAAPVGMLVLAPLMTMIFLFHVFLDEPWFYRAWERRSSPFWRFWRGFIGQHSDRYGPAE